MTFPDCAIPAGLVGIIRPAIRASCRPSDALEIRYPAGWGPDVVNCSVPGLPSALHVPPVTFTASVEPVPLR